MKEVRHIGIIMDGNRRFAKRLMRHPSKGHEWGAKKVGKLLEWCKEVNVKELTLYSLSLENFNRPKEEFDYLMSLFRKEFDNLKEDKRIYNNKIRIRGIGRIHMLPDDVQEKVREIEEKTKDHDQYQINFALAYGGRSEITDATKIIAEKVKNNELEIDDIDEELVKNHLYLSHEPDFIIRTGGDHRTSNFLPYQSTYAELFFLNKMWPEFEKEDLLSIIEQFQMRDRRFGK
ncbi:MAG: polyprenyl diphosphate synthase [Candidatus Woesearchaeota archaeon]